MLENVQAENKKLAETCAIMEQDIVKYQDSIKRLKENKKEAKVLAVDRKKLLKEVKMKDRELFKLRKEMNQLQTEVKVGQETLNSKIH